MPSPEQALRLPAEKSVTDSESAYIPKMLRMVDVVLARHSQNNRNLASHRDVPVAK